MKSTRKTIFERSLFSNYHTVSIVYDIDNCSVIQNIADMKPKARYIVATDDSQTTLEEIVKVAYLRTLTLLLYMVR